MEQRGVPEGLGNWRNSKVAYLLFSRQVRKVVSKRPQLAGLHQSSRAPFSLTGPLIKNNFLGRGRTVGVPDRRTAQVRSSNDTLFNQSGHALLGPHSYLTRRLLVRDTIAMQDGRRGRSQFCF